MNPLSIFNGAGRAAGLKDESFVSRDDAAQDDAGTQRGSFASMLNSPSPSQAAPPPQAARSQTAKREDSRPRQDDDRAGQEEGKRTQGQDPTQSRTQRAEAGASQKTTPTGQAETPEGTEAAPALAETGESADTDGHDAGAWPPPGLGGFGLMLLQPATATTTVPDMPALASAATAHAGTALLSGLPQPDAAAPAAAVPGAAPTGAIALPGLAAAAATAPNASADEAAALAALAATALTGGATAATATADGDAPAIDTPTFVLPNLPHAASASTRPQDAAAVFSASPTPTPDLHGDGFDEAVGTRLTWLAEQKIGHAHIKITPNDLGPVEVRLQMDGDKVHASFTASHVETRQALEQSLPRLRDMLGEHGFQLAHADVGAQQQGQRQEAGASAGFDGPAEGTGEDAASVVVPASVLRARGLLDAYA